MVSTSLTDSDARFLAEKFMRSQNNEACITALMQMHCIFGHLAGMLQTAPIASYKFEHHIGCGRIDLLLRHVDGGFSIVEVKSDSSIHNVVAGIGQLFLYEALLKSAGLAHEAPAYIDKFLVSTIQGVSAEHVRLACRSAGVNFFEYPSFGFIAQVRAQYMHKWVGHGT